MRRAAVLAAIVAALWLLVAPARAQSQSPDLPTYDRWLREAFAAAQRNDRLALEEVAGRLAATTSVQLPGGASATVDNRWLRDELDKPEPDLTEIARRLGAIIDALALPASAAPSDARERLKDIFAHPPFQRAASDSAAQQWWRDFWDWVGRLIDDLLRPVGQLAPTTGVTISWVIAGVGGALLLGVIIYLLIGLRRGMAAEAQADDEDAEARLTAKTALGQAGDLARGGDYRTAVRYLYLSALLWLDERDMLRYDRALTNREYLDRVRDNPALRGRLAPIVETFDQVWYGHASIDAAAFAAYREQIEALRGDKELS